MSYSYHSHPSIHHVFVCIFCFCWILCGTLSENCMHYELVERIEHGAWNLISNKSFMHIMLESRRQKQLKPYCSFTFRCCCFRTRRRRRFHIFSFYFQLLCLLNAISANEFKTFFVLIHFGTKRTDYCKLWAISRTRVCLCARTSPHRNWI